MPRHAIIKKFAGEDITKLDDFIAVLSKLSRGARVPLEYISYTDRHRRKVLLVPLKYIVGCRLSCLIDIYFPCKNWLYLFPTSFHWFVVQQYNELPVQIPSRNDINQQNWNQNV